MSCCCGSVQAEDILASMQCHGRFPCGSRIGKRVLSVLNSSTVSSRVSVGCCRAEYQRFVQGMIWCVLRSIAIGECESCGVLSLCGVREQNNREQTNDVWPVMGS
jgi:hypothetical protein